MASSEQLHANPLHDISLDEDWISLMLTDVGLDVMDEAESDARLSSFDDLPLPDMGAFDWSISCDDIIDSDLMITSDDYIVDSDLTRGNDCMVQGASYSPQDGIFSQFIDNVSCFSVAHTHACQHDDASKHRVLHHTCQHNDISKHIVLPHTCKHDDVSKKEISMHTWQHEDSLKKEMLLPTCQDDNDSKCILPHSCQRDDASKKTALPHLCQHDDASKNSASHGDASKKSFPSHTCQHDDNANKSVLSHDDTSKRSVLSHDDTSEKSALSHSCQHEAGIIFEAVMSASLSPESGVTHGSSSSACKDSDSSIHDKDSVIHDKYSCIPSMDSGSEEDDLYCFVSKICSEGSESSDLAHEIALNSENMSSHSPNIGNIGKSSRKRKNLEENTGEAPPRDYEVKDGDDDEEKRRARLMRNRESAQLSRQRKKLYVDELQEKIKTMASTIAELNNTINLISNENINLRRQLSMFGPPASGQSGGMPGLPPWMGTYHPNPMMGGNFMVPNAQVPLVAIPRWKSNTALDHSKESKPKKGSTEKGSKRTRKAAGITAMGFLFFVFILFPVNFNMWLFKPNIKEETNAWSTHIETGKTLVRAGGRVLTGISESHVSRIFDEHDSNWKLAENGKDSQARKVQPKGEDISTNGSSFLMNGSVPLAATLFVPRHDGLVRIEGNLIIHSVLASNEATIEKKNNTVRMPIPLYDKGLALDANLKAVALKAAPEEKGALVELQRALAKKTRLDFEESGLQSLQEDGSFPQWFVEDLSGPVFSSGMCTEVFQFEMSPSSATSSQRTNVEDDRIQDKRKLEEQGHREPSGRSFLHSRKSASYAVPLPPVGHKAILKGGSKERNVTNGKTGYSSSIVVSVLAESEFGEQAKSMGGGKGPATIFIVVLIDNVKYITYSCKLPSVASTPKYEVVVA